MADEPVVGLDVNGRNELAQLRSAYRAIAGSDIITPEGRVALLWDVYLAMLQIEADVEAGAKVRGKKSTLSEERRRTVKQLSRDLGRWPTADDAFGAMARAGELSADLQRVITSDLERLEQPQTRRRTQQGIFNDKLAKLRRKGS